MSRARRIALVTGNFISIVDGVALTLRRLVAHLRAQGDEVLVLAPRPRDPQLPPMGDFVTLPSFVIPAQGGYRYSYRLSARGRRALEEFKPDLVHCSAPDLANVAARKWARANDVPVVASFHSDIAAYLKYSVAWFMRASEPFAWNYFRWIYKDFDHLYVPTPAVIEELKEAGLSSQMRLWSRGVEAEQFTPRMRSAQWRTSVGAEGDEPIVLFCARLFPEKGIREFADAVRMLEEQGVAHKSVVVGDGMSRKAMEGWLPNTRFLGRLEGEALRTAYASSDLFLYPSTIETFGNVILEAMASGLPTICARARGATALVADEETGRLCRPDDAEDFFRATRVLLENEALRREWGAKARARALTFDWQAILDGLVQNYDELISSTGPRV